MARQGDVYVVLERGDRYRWILCDSEGHLLAMSDPNWTFGSREEAEANIRGGVQQAWNAPINPEDTRVILADGIEYQIVEMPREEPGTGAIRVTYRWELIDLRVRPQRVIVASRPAVQFSQRGECEADIDELRRYCDAPVNPGSFRR